MFAVALAGVWLSLAAHSDRLRLRSADYAWQAMGVWPPPNSPYDAGPQGAEFDRLKATELRYAARSRDYRSAANRIDRLLVASLFIPVSLGAAAGIPALFRWGSRRSPPGTAASPRAAADPGRRGGSLLSSRPSSAAGSAELWRWAAISMVRWLVRLPAVVLIAVVMGWLGLLLLFLGGPWFPSPNEFWTRYVLAASVVLWAVLSAALGRRSLATWGAWGLASPLLGCLLVAPPASFALVIVKCYIAFPVGLATGVLVWAVFRVGPPPNLALQRARPAAAPAGQS